MKKSHFQSAVSMALAAVLLASLAGCGEKEIKSIWLESPSAARSLPDDPQQGSVSHFIAKGEGAIDIFNDDKTLIVQLSTRNRNLHRQLTTTGLTVWFDETGGNKKRYALSFPPGRSSQGEKEAQPGSRVGRREESNQATSFSRHDASNPGTIEITGPGENEFSIISAKDSKLYGIQYRSEGAGGYFVHELRMPLIRDAAFPYGIVRHKPKVISICLESSQKGNTRIDTGITIGGGGRGPQGRGGKGSNSQGSAGRSDMGQGTQREPIKLWMKVQLAANPDRSMK